MILRGDTLREGVAFWGGEWNNVIYRAFYGESVECCRSMSGKYTYSKTKL